MRVEDHPILGPAEAKKMIQIVVDGKSINAVEGEPIAASLLASGIGICRRTPKNNDPRGVFCAAGQCTDCMMMVDGIPNVRTCITPAKQGMKIKTQIGLGRWDRKDG